MKASKKSSVLQILLPGLILIAGIILALLIDYYGVVFVTPMKTIFSFLFYFYIISVCIVVFLEEKNPQRMISWLLILIFFPGVGLFFYLAFGRSYRKKYRVRQKKIEECPELTGIQDRKNLKCVEKLDITLSPLAKSLITLLQNNSDSNLLLFNEVKVMADGVVTFALMLESIEKAKQTINFQFFIVKDDELSNRFKNLLIKKAKEGVEVNFLYDAVGSWRLSKEYKNALIDAGVNVLPFLPVIAPFISREFNYRNHRKIVTIDGHVGFVGGLNIGDEYIGKKEQFGYWRDTHIMLKGESVYALQNIFIADWEFSGGSARGQMLAYKPIVHMQPSLMQIAGSGPDSDKNVIMQAYFKMIAMARESIYITTPYLVPEESLLVAIKTAALSGVDVKIIIPHIADHIMAYWANQSNIEDLLKSNVEIYYYMGGFIHSKSLMVDGLCSSVGTANLDIRSMELNFEVNAFIYDPKVVKEIISDFMDDLKRSEKINLETFRKRKKYRKVLEAFGRLASPLQ